jgi:hypothetical protein
MFENIKTYYRSLHVKKENLIPFIVFISIIIVTSLIFGATQATSGLLLLLLGILCLVTSVMAAIAVFRSLVIASVSLTLIIFLGQSYCGPDVVHNANDAAMMIVGCGFVYSIGIFIVSLYKELWGDKKDPDKKGSFKTIKEIYEGKVPWMISIPYALFIGIFLVDLYRVVNPIIQSLCIYK